MPPLLLKILAGFGVVFLLLILALAYFVITDPFNIRPYLFGTFSSETVRTPAIDTGEAHRAPAVSTEEGRVDALPTDEAGSSTVGDPTVAEKEIILTESQKQMLQGVGIDPASIPSSVSAEFEACLRNTLGADRVEAIIAGQTPSPLELLRASSCF